ncbi:MAG TPA: AraC family transcriptional regulator [Rectinemataceae bacterium]|nr:AraC family transcriptional regulator [Rectinemataceae bacterium]
MRKKQEGAAAAAAAAPAAVDAGALAGLLDLLAAGEGHSPSRLEQVRFIRVTDKSPRGPIVYEPGIIVVGQGRKIGYLGGKVYVYDPNNYLVLSVPLPFECETTAEPGKPFLAVSISMDSGLLGELVAELDDGLAAPESVTGIYSTPLTPELMSATVRLLECLRSETDSRILGRQIVREITYHVLKGPQGIALRAVVARDSRFAQIAKVLRRIHESYSRELSVQSLAEEVNMSVSAFHHNFKAVTSSSPLQYLKSIRLHKARLLMAQEGLGAGLAAEKVGYASPSQFSREFKRFFGESPREDAAKLRRG